MNEQMGDVVRKVRKLLAHGEKNKNEHEASSAMDMARKLMEEHNLAMSDVQIEEVKKTAALDKEAGWSRYLCPWERHLAQAIAYLFDTYTYGSMKYETDKLDHYYGKEVFSMRFIGLPEDVSISLEAYDTLRETLGRMGRESGFKGTDMRTYLLGVSSRLQMRAKRLRDDFLRQQEAALQASMQPAVARVGDEDSVEQENANAEPPKANCTALMIVKEKLIDEVKDKLGLRKARASRVGGSRQSYDAGQRAGNDISLGFRSELK